MKKQWEVFSCPDPLYNTDEKKVLSGCKSNGKEVVSVDETRKEGSLAETRRKVVGRSSLSHYLNWVVLAKYVKYLGAQP